MKANSKNFSKVHKSEADDFAHLTGAAYCDLFTCDTRIKDDLGRYRRLLGFRDAISFGNGVTEEQFITTIARDFDVISDFRGARAD
jgi:hypothetical protein